MSDDTCVDCEILERKISEMQDEIEEKEYKIEAWKRLASDAADVVLTLDAVLATTP